MLQGLGKFENRVEQFSFPCYRQFDDVAHDVFSETFAPLMQVTGQRWRRGGVSSCRNFVGGRSNHETGQ
jgi:hypothetical protein